MERLGTYQERMGACNRPGNSSRSFLEPEFISEKILPICVIFDIDEILKYDREKICKYVNMTQFLQRSVVFRYIQP